jgi:soluble lytic murein transglycosylase
MRKRTNNTRNRALFIATAFLLSVFILAVTPYSMFPAKYRDIVITYSEKYDLDPALIFAVIKTESNFNSDAVSHKNARGLMQVTDRTGEWGASVLKIDEFSQDLLYCPEINIEIGCWYMAMLLKEFRGDTDLALAAYNAGSGNVTKWLNDEQLSSSGESLDRIPFGETDRYLKKVKSLSQIYNKLYKF